MLIIYREKLNIERRLVLPLLLNARRCTLVFSAHSSRGRFYFLCPLFVVVIAYESLKLPVENPTAQWFSDEF